MFGTADTFYLSEVHVHGHGKLIERLKSWVMFDIPSEVPSFIVS